jgi:hypothetical protein
LLLQTCLLSTPFPMQKLIQVPLSEEIQIAYGGKKVKRKIVTMGLQTEGTHQRATLQFRTCLGRFRQERKAGANREVLPHCRGCQGCWRGSEISFLHLLYLRSPICLLVFSDAQCLCSHANAHPDRQSIRCCRLYTRRTQY